MFETSPYSRMITTVLGGKVKFKSYPSPNGLNFKIYDTEQKGEEAIFTLFAGNNSRMPILIMGITYTGINSNIALFEDETINGQVKINGWSLPQSELSRLIQIANNSHHLDLIRCKDLIGKVLESNCNEQKFVKRYNLLSKELPPILEYKFGRN